MTIQQLNYAIIISEMGSFNKASEVLYIAQPSLTSAIRELEKEQMRRNVLDYEPGIALFVPDEDPLLFYRAVARWAQRFLRPGGAGLVEINEALGPDTAAVFTAAGFKNVQILPDFAHKSRFIRF